MNATANPAPVIVKLGGRAFEAAGAFEAFAAEAATFGQPLVLVHGGGADVTRWCLERGVAPGFVDGLRVTDDATLEIAVAVLAGLANKRLVAALRASGIDAVGLAALDGGIAHVAPHPDAARLGHVGQVESIDASLLATLLDAGRTPVLASIGAHGSSLLNLNADDVAGALAATLGAPLVLLSDTPGVRVSGTIVRRLDARQAGELAAHPEVTGGMRHKLVTARDAVEHGARFARIAQWGAGVTFASLLGRPGPGTTVFPNASSPQPDTTAHPMGVHS